MKKIIAISLALFMATPAFSYVFEVPANSAQLMYAKCVRENFKNAPNGISEYDKSYFLAGVCYSELKYFIKASCEELDPRVRGKFICSPRQLTGDYVWDLHKKIFYPNGF